MNIESLQQKTDRELNELSALIIMGWTLNTLINFPARYTYEDSVVCEVREWNPINNMNDVLQLEKEMNDEELQHKYCNGIERVIRQTTGFGLRFDLITASPEVRTIAAILAKMS